ncbi:MAG: metallophosphoesterase [Dorea formicigenerans]
MIYITGDCHRNFERFNTRNFPEQKEMTKDDYVIICGDFGGVWNKDGESKMETSVLDWLDGKAFTTLFVDGNHENFDRLYAYPVEKKIRQTARFKKWFFGHYHDNRNVTKDELLLWEQIIRIS